MKKSIRRSYSYVLFLVSFFIIMIYAAEKNSETTPDRSDVQFYSERQWKNSENIRESSAISVTRKQIRLLFVADAIPPKN